MTILLLHDAVAPDAPPDELDTLVQVSEVSGVLQLLGHRVLQQEFTADIPEMLRLIDAANPTLVFNLVDTLSGGALIHLAPLVCNLLGRRCTGCSSQALVATSNKLWAKRMLHLAGIPTPGWHSAVVSSERAVPDELIGFPVIVKPVSEEGSVGIDDTSVRIFSTGKELRQFLEGSAKAMFVERYIDGREFNVSLMPRGSAVEVFPLAEILFTGYGPDKPRIVGYKAKWLEESFEYTHTPRSFDCNSREPALTALLSSIAVECWELFGSQGHARVDFRVDILGNPYVLEVNFNPCIARDSGFSAAAQEAGMTHAQMVRRIVEEAV